MERTVVAVPQVPALQVAFALMGAGVLFGGFSKNVPAKRVVLPITIILFGVVWLESIRRTFDPPVLVLHAFAVFMALNGATAMRTVRFCSRCGATIQEGKRRTICEDCSSKRTH